MTGLHLCVMAYWLYVRIVLSAFVLTLIALSLGIYFR